MHFSPKVATAGWDWFCGRWGNSHDVWTQKTLTKSMQLVCGGTEEIQDQDHQTEAWMVSISVQNYRVANSLQSSESTGDLTLILFLLWKFHCSFQTKERQEIDVILTKKASGSWTSLVFQWLRLLTPSAGGVGSIPGQEIKVLHATRCDPPPPKKITGSKHLLSVIGPGHK